MNANIFAYVVIIICAFWVFFDAINHRIGPYRVEVNGKIKIKGISPIFWGILTLAFFIIAFPYYLFRRKTLIENAKDAPVNTDKSLGIIILIILSALILYYSK